MPIATIAMLASAVVVVGRLQAQTGGSPDGTMGHAMPMGRPSPSPFVKLGGAYLDLHLQSMALGTTNPAAGEHLVGTDSNAIVSVSPECVGAHRCPLFIFLPGAGQSAQHITNWLRRVADKYGMLVLTFTDRYFDPPHMKRALTEVLQHYAVDPTRIAVIGRCMSGRAGMRYGLDNPDVFSRIALISGEVPPSGPETAAQKSVEVLLDVGVLEADAAFAAEKAWRADGHPVKVLIGQRGHEDQVEDYDFLGRWLTDSWAYPDPATRVQPPVIAEVPVLRSDALTKLTTFWTLFSREPDSVFNTARLAHLHEIVLPVGLRRTSLYLVDMPALAKQVPSVAADLKQAGLTAEEHDAYRVALIGARVATVLQQSSKDNSAVSEMLGNVTTSVLGQNIAFINSHRKEMNTLAHAGMSHSDKLEDPLLGGRDHIEEYMGMPGVVSYNRPNPAYVKKYGAMGIWRTP